MTTLGRVACGAPGLKLVYGGVKLFRVGGMCEKVLWGK